MATPTDLNQVIAIRKTPEVFARWKGDNSEAEFLKDLAEDDHETLVVELDGAVVGGMELWEENGQP